MKRSIQTFFLIAVFSTSFLACDKTEVEVCKTDKPFRHIKWLKEMRNDFRFSRAQQRIVQYDYNNERVFLIENCNDCSDSMATVYNCKKETVCQFGGIAGMNTCPDFEDNATNKEILYED